MPDMQAESEFEGEMDAISTVYSLRAGMVLTDAHYQAIQAFDGASRRDQERATDAFHRGYQQGLAEGAAADVAALINKNSSLRTDLTFEKALHKFDEQRIDKLHKLVASLSEALTDEGGDWSIEGLDLLRRDVAAALPDGMLPDWLLAYRSEQPRQAADKPIVAHTSHAGNLGKNWDGTERT